VVGLGTFALGLVFRFGDKITSKYVDSAVTSLKKAVDDIGIDNSTGIDIDTNNLLYEVSITCIVIGKITQ